MKQIEYSISDLLSLHEASNLSGLSQGHINFLVRNQKLWGIKLGRNWFTTKKSLEEYLQSYRKPGSKKS